jgi:hypothetical protein
MVLFAKHCIGIGPAVAAALENTVSAFRHIKKRSIVDLLKNEPRKSSITEIFDSFSFSSS